MIFITRYDLWQGAHGFFNRLGVHTFILFMDLMFFFLELVHWIGGDPLLFCDGLFWLSSFFKVTYLWLMEL